MVRSTAARAGLATAAAGAIGLGVLTVPAGAGQAPSLPDVAAEQLVASVLTAKPPALAGTVQLDNALGLPALPGMSDEQRPGESPLSEPATTARVWSDGQGRSRLALPSHGGEQTYVADGDTLWRYDSASRTATAIEHGERLVADQKPAVDPAAAAQAVVSRVRETSSVAVDGTARVAGRPAYELVLTPAPTERTLLREVRVAVDSATRMPLQLTVLANGSPEPALQAGFTDLDVSPQDAGLFTFTAPEGVPVQRPELPQRSELSPPASTVRTVGDGWDTVVLGRLPAAGDTGADPLAMARELGRPASGPWGDGWAIDTAVGTVLVASDGRVAAGAVPQQVLDEALAR
ncbi:MAG: outer membrane lipoprotein carrier protein LolA [Pseudonocardiaceae bacterium]|nr:outer membrane lipoprotein carrier protein LolA [Pseudonocardiaceae bacterium]